MKINTLVSVIMQCVASLGTGEQEAKSGSEDSKGEKPWYSSNAVDTANEGWSEQLCQCFPIQHSRDVAIHMDACLSKNET